MIPQYSRISHHTNTTGITFSIPLSEDFTNGSWDTSNLTLSEIGVDELNKDVYIRIGDVIKKFSFDQCCDIDQSECCEQSLLILKEILNRLKPTIIYRPRIVYKYVEVRTVQTIYVSKPCGTKTPPTTVVITKPITDYRPGGWIALGFRKWYYYKAQYNYFFLDNSKYILQDFKFGALTTPGTLDINQMMKATGLSYNEIRNLIQFGTITRPKKVIKSSF
jgi:hypothetical protein